MPKLVHVRSTWLQSLVLLVSAGLSRSGGNDSVPTKVILAPYSVVFVAVCVNVNVFVGGHGAVEMLSRLAR